MIVIYSHKITTRLEYVLELVFNHVLNTDYQLTDNPSEFKETELAKLFYSETNDEADVFIKSDDLLFETDIKKELPNSSSCYLDFPVFFESSPDSIIPYDIFATVFYFATRYEEYISHDLDKHQRFKAENSLAFKYNLLEKPFLNYLIEDFGQKLKQRFPQIEFKKRDFNFLSTIDIDNAYAYANKGLRRNIGGALKDFSAFKFKDVAKRIKSNMDESVDPYNTYPLINSFSRETQTALQYFVLIGDYSTYDKNPHYQNKAFRVLLKNLATEYKIGLHPSYESYNHPDKIAIEKQRLEEIIGKTITSVRCHFLRVKFPETYRKFIELGIKDDFTMIYASKCGFRTGLCVPYKWFDLERNEKTNLSLHTSVVMEGVLRDYNQLKIDKAQQQVNYLLNEVKQFGGEFVSIYHNDSFVPEQNEWIDLYQKLLINAKEVNT